MNKMLLIIICFSFINSQTIYLELDNYNSEDGSVEVVYTSSEAIAGFQFTLEGINISGVGGGVASDAGFTVSTGGGTVIGFSFSASTLPLGTEIMTIVYFDNNISELLCISDPVISDANGSEMDVEIGECLQLEENNICEDAIINNCGLCYEGTGAEDNNFPLYGPGDLWGYIQSTSQGFILIDNISVFNETAVSGTDDGSPSGACPDQNCDIVAAIYNGYTIGWSYSTIVNGDITIAVNLNDFTTPGVENYPTPGSNINIEFYDESSGIVYNTFNYEIQVMPFGLSEIGILTIDEMLNYECAVIGCMDHLACNFNPEAELDSGLCEYPEDFYDCDGFCISDIDEDGICDELDLDCIYGNLIDNCGFCYEGVELNQNHFPSYGPGELWGYTGSTSQAFILIDEILVFGESAIGGIYDGTPTGECVDQNCDIISVMYNGVSVGWSYSTMANDDITIAVNLNDYSTPGVENYPTLGEIVNFEFYDASEGTVYNTLSFETEVYPFQLAQIGIIEIDETINLDCPIIGCMDSTACNYDPNATTEGGCEFSQQYYDCNNVCQNDIDQDNVCDELEIEGCMDLDACNYENTATDQCLNCCEFSELYFDCDGNCLYQLDCLSICNGSAIIDNCGVCNGNDINMDCLGICNGSAEIDNCGVCDGNNIDMDCSGECFGNSIQDNCGTCDNNPLNDCILDCLGIWGGNAHEDACDICEGDNIANEDGFIIGPDAGCDGICFSGLEIDICGECNGMNSCLEDAHPVIINIVDIPADQGGFIGIQYYGSIFDYMNYEYEIDNYSFWRSLDVDEDSIYNSNSFPNSEHHLNTRDEYWEFVGSQPAINFETYGYTAPTLVDSSINGFYWSKFIVIAHTPDDDIFFVSEPDSGYSIDNLSPGIPELISAIILNNEEILISWNQVSDEDFNHYAVYRFESPDIEILEPIALISDTSFIDITIENINQNYYYAVSAFDYNGNEGSLSPLVQASSLEIEETNLIKNLKLFDPYPNPFNPVTFIQYSVFNNINVSINIYDINGVNIKELINSNHTKGIFTVEWNADDKVPSGIYFVKLIVGDITKTKKIILMK